MNLLKDLFKRGAKNINDRKVIFVITERLKPWIVLSCLEKDNYIITDNKAEEIAVTIIKQAISLNALEKVLDRIL